MEKSYGLQALIVAVITLIVGSYLALASGNQLWPFRNSAGSSADAVPAAYQADWSGSIGLSALPVQLDLTLQSGEVNERVGQIATSYGCATAVILKQGGGPITLSLNTTTSSTACHMLFAAFNHFTVTLTGSDSLELSVRVGGRSVSCYLH
jgi:hypothetical protein